MSNLRFLLTAFGLSACLSVALEAQTEPPTKIGVVDLQSVIIKTRDGEKAANDLKAKFAPKQAGIDRKEQ
jgi:Skp family chaperone for outer membrane proteins